MNGGKRIVGHCVREERFINFSVAGRKGGKEEGRSGVVCEEGKGTVFTDSRTPLPE